MYSLSKRTISQYLRAECQRRLRLNLYATDRLRKAANAPVKDVSRPGLALLAEQGRRFEREKFNELSLSFKGRVIHGAITEASQGEERAFGRIALSDHLDACGHDHFIVEAEYPVTQPFVTAHGLDDLKDGMVFPAGMGASLAFANVRPDILQIRPPTGGPRRIVDPSGEIIELSGADARLGLRIVDIKLTGEPSPSHFAELAYYQMTLAAWLQYTERAEKFVVLKDAAVWPGKHEASEIRRLETEDSKNGVRDRDLGKYLSGLETDLEFLPAEVVLGRVRRFFAVDLRAALLPADWRSLPWHVDSGCSGCDYLGYKWRDNADESDEKLPADVDQLLHCWQEAKAGGHLSRVVGLSRGACGKLREKAVSTIEALAALEPGNRIFEGHQKLRAGRTLFRARSDVLRLSGRAEIPDRVGTSALLPRRADIKVALSIDFDVGSGITFAVGYRLLREVPVERVSAEYGGWFKTRKERDQHRVMLVEQRSIEAEGTVLSDLMRRMVDDIRASALHIEQAYQALGQTPKERNRKATLQIYIWDKLTFEHLRRVMGRHLLKILAANAASGGKSQGNTAPMAWIFPADQIIQDADFTSTGSPLSIVNEAISALLAANVPHHYSLLSLANEYHPSWMDRDDFERPNFRVHPFFSDPLTDQIPSERGHEIWNQRSPFGRADYQQYREILRRAVRTRLNALMAIAERLTEDLKDSLVADAPAVSAVFDQTQPVGAIARDSEIIYQHARLMAAAAKLDVEVLMAMPPHQREAAFESVRLESLLTGGERRAALEAVGRGELVGNGTVMAFRMSSRSTQAKIKAGDFTWSLMPEAALVHQHATLARMKRLFSSYERVAGPAAHLDFSRRLREACAVEVIIFDRATRLLVARPTDRSELLSLVRAGVINFDIDGSAGRFAILDPLSIDFFVKWRLQPALKAIRVPPLSRERPLFRDPDLTRLSLRNARQTAPVPAERFIWDADRLSQEVSTCAVRVGLNAVRDEGLTARQSDAVENALRHRLSLLWGPPGTGKSRTAGALLKALIAEAKHRGVPLRVAITGPTWVAIETVAKRAPEIVAQLGLSSEVCLARLASQAPVTDVDDALRNYVVVADGTDPHLALIERLKSSQITIVAGTSFQLAKLLPKDEPRAEYFDFMIIDEASQMSVAHAIVAFTTLTNEARVTVIGDNLQMPPIQQVPPPVGSEHLVGSVYDFYCNYRAGEDQARAVTPVMLDRSYRSNSEIVDFIRLAGYGEELQAVKPDLRMRLSGPISTNPTSNWPAQLPWNEHLNAILNPEQPLVAIVHPDQYSSQRNDAEADLVAGLVWSLYGRLLPEAGSTPLDPLTFFGEGVGIVTPHRAQQSAVAERLQHFVDGHDAIEAMLGAVDTVERFQGQEKTVMIASFGLGDRDQIATEEEFLFSLNRFNVIASRAKEKLIVILSRPLVDHLPRDPKMLRQSKLLKHYADGYLGNVRNIEIPGLGLCELKWK